ncbi:NADPH:quinone oxidoreductase family protein [Aurantimonas sp. Leaf443]|uniref:NADPH:quinone oxidoreductase family protein n=1 Tax=Aurantimonas sp. Leaf443 TaxID=1736378 RepID=UPI0006F5A008|nr:NADPH:quinone oxidoreductase family protein [Aurantimonas sp. Leaf443]KQT85738.1 NADPH:quinone oxidoreductase [Aurantimonas sp. Leaf443]
MRAVVCEAYGPIADLKVEDLPDPSPGPGEILIAPEAIGVNYPDGLLVQGLYQARPALPFVPGMEAAGRVLEVGPGVTHFGPGDRVAVLLDTGAYATRVLAPETSAFALPDGIEAGVACALLCGYGTAHHALKQRAALRPGETLLVLGASGLTGLGAIEIGRAMGARVIAVASTKDKRRVALEAGAHEAIGYQDLRADLKRLTEGRGVDVAFDPVGGEAFDTLARSMAWNGRLLVVGFASGTIPSLPVNLALVKGFSVVGVFWGAFTRKQPAAFAANVETLFAWVAEGRIRPLVSERLPLARAADALARIHARGTVGKLVLVP